MFRNWNKVCNKILREIATFCVRLINQYKSKNQTVIPPRLEKQDKDGQMLDEIESFINSGVNQNLTQYDIHNFNVRFQLKQQLEDH